MPSRSVCLLAAAGFCVAGIGARAGVLVYRATGEVVTNSIQSGPLVGLTGAVVAEVSIDTGVGPSILTPAQITWDQVSGRVIGARVTVGGTEVLYTVDRGVETAFDGFQFALDEFRDQFNVVAFDDSPAVSSGVRVSLEVESEGSNADTATTWQLPAVSVGGVDISGFDPAMSEIVIGGQPSGAIFATVTSLEVVVSEPCVGDVTTTNTNPGDAGYGEPDGEVDGADLSFFVEAWLTGCP